MSSESRRGPQIAATLLAVAVALVLITNLPYQPDTRLADALQNFGHAPLFGVAAILIVRAFRISRAESLRPFWLALGWALLLGAATEVIQLQLGGDAEWQDVATDLAGAAAFLAVYWCFTSPASKSMRWTVGLSAITILSVAAIPLIVTAAATWQRNRAFPILADFNSGPARRFFSAKDASFELVPAPAASSLPQGSRMARITFQPAQYPSFAIDEPYPDWTSYKELSFLAYSELPAPISLMIRIHDEHHNNETSDRFNAALSIKPGLNPIRIPLRDIETALSGRRMDMHAIKGVRVFALSPAQPLSVYVGDIRLR